MGMRRTMICVFLFGSKGKVLEAELASVHIFGQPKKTRNRMGLRRTMIFVFFFGSKGAVVGAKLAGGHSCLQPEKHKIVWFGADP